MIDLVLDDGRTLTASPRHPLADGRALEELATGDIVDGASVVSANRVAYEETHTYDILPDGSTGLYWADEILIGSTLSRSPVCGKAEESACLHGSFGLDSDFGKLSVS